jgi:hypothetical protein
MLGNPQSKPMKANGKESLDQILQSAIVVSWTDLMRGTEAGLIHIEYDFVPTGTLDYLKIWSSITRGHWLLACEYWMSASTFHGTGVRFDNGYESEGLAHILEFAMQHQREFTLPADLGRQGLLQICTPTPEETAAATASVNEALDHSSSAEPALA